MALKGVKDMPTMFGKFCRVLRINKSEVLRDMAKKLCVSSSYLSAVENGKRPIPQDWYNKIIVLYGLSSNESDELADVIYRTRNEVSFELDRFSKDDGDMIIAFARKFSDLEDGEKILLEDLFKRRT